VRQIRKRTTACFPLVIALSLGASLAQAGDSDYTSIAEKDCRKLSALKVADTDYAASRVCAGRSGYRIFVDEEDLRETLTVGKTMQQAGKEPAARDHFRAFNSFGDRIEWRSDNSGRPYAIIVGWSFADNDSPDATGRPKSRRLLVVMRLPPGPVCEIAYIDRDANGDAIALARKAADDVARDFKCGTAKTAIVGNAGPAIAAMTRIGADGASKP
jgi:hypothetical protein